MVVTINHVGDSFLQYIWMPFFFTDILNSAEEHKVVSDNASLLCLFLILVINKVVVILKRGNDIFLQLRVSSC